jgi:restriction system protein
MPLPTYQEMMLPLLRVLQNATEPLPQKEYTQRVADLLNLTAEEQALRLPSGVQTHILNRAGWAGWHMQQAGLVEKPKKGHLRITAEGLRLLGTNPAVIDNKFLAANYPAFASKLRRQPQDGEGEAQEVEEGAKNEEQTPTEQIEQAYARLNQTLASDLRELMAKMDPYKFEQLVVDLLFAMGYGGSRAGAAWVTKKANDEGIDGIINEDRLGLDVIYVQAKRWQGPVGRPDIQSFVGALAMKNATKGVFITTSKFQDSAQECARIVPQKVILIDGQRLAELMIEYNIGVSTVQTLAIKRVDSDYFEEA